MKGLDKSPAQCRIEKLTGQSFDDVFQAASSKPKQTPCYVAART